MNKTIQFYDKSFTNAAQSSLKSAYTGKDDVPIVNVPCGSLTKVLLDIFPQGRITFFSLDVEGAEIHLLKNLNFSQVFIEIMMIESFNSFCRKKCPAREKVREFMKNNG